MPYCAIRIRSREARSRARMTIPNPHAPGWGMGVRNLKGLLLRQADGTKPDQ